MATSLASRRRLLLLALTGIASACSEPAPSPPVDDCAIQSDGSMICPRSFPGCTLHADVAVQFERCGHRSEYVVYGRAESCPEIYYYPEGSFLSPGDWQAYVGACDGRVSVE